MYLLSTAGDTFSRVMIFNDILLTQLYFMNCKILYI